MRPYPEPTPVVLVTSSFSASAASTIPPKRAGGGAPPPRLALNSIASLPSSDAPDSARDSVQGGVPVHGSVRTSGATSLKDRSITPQSAPQARGYIGQTSRDEQPSMSKITPEGNGSKALPKSLTSSQVGQSQVDVPRVLSNSPSRRPQMKSSSKSPTRYSCPAPSGAPSASTSSKSPREMRVSPSGSTIPPSTRQSGASPRPQGPSPTLGTRQQQQAFGTSPKLDTRQAPNASPPVVGMRSVLGSAPPAVASTTPAWATLRASGSKQPTPSAYPGQVHPQLAASLAQNNSKMPNTRATFPCAMGAASNDTATGRVGGQGQYPCSPASMRSFRDLRDPLTASGRNSSSTVIPNGSRLTGNIAPETKEDRETVLRDLLTSVEAIDRQLGSGKIGQELDASNLTDLAAMAAAAAKAVATVAAVAANSAVSNSGSFSNPGALPEGTILEELSEIPDTLGAMVSPTITTPRQVLSSRTSNLRVPGGSLNANMPPSPYSQLHNRGIGQSPKGGAFSCFNKVGSLSAVDVITQIQSACDEALKRTEADEELAGLRAARDEVCGLREEAMECQRLQKEREAKLRAGLEEALAAKGNAERQLAEAQERLARLERPQDEKKVAEAREWASKYEEADRERKVYKQWWQEAQHELQRTDPNPQVNPIATGSRDAVINSPPLPPAVSPRTVISNRRSLPARGRQGGLGQGPPVGAHRRALA